MNAITEVDFRWLSPLGISVVLFMFSGFFRIVIGTLTPIFMNSAITRPAIVMTERTDRELFKEEPATLLRDNEPMAKTRTLTLTLLAGLLLTAGIFAVSIAWFGLKSGNWWALSTLSVAGIAEIPFWFLFLKYYIDAGIHLTLADIPPFIWVPEILLIPAVILGIIGLRQV